MTELISTEQSSITGNKVVGKPDIHFLVPLCGKSVDLVYLYEQGFQTTGCECSEVACEQFFVENKIPFIRTKLNDKFECFQVQFKILYMSRANGWK